MSNENTQLEGNPDVMSDEGAQSAAEDAVFGSPDSFFEALEDQVNGAIVDDKSGPEQATPQYEGSDSTGTNVEVPQDDVQTLKSKLETAEKRYSGSSRESQKMKAQLDELKPFVPVLEAMKNDSGLVDYVRDYFKNGGDVPVNVKERLKLDEDFEIDMDEAITDPESNSKKVFDTMVDNVVNKRIKETLQDERGKAEDFRKQVSLKKHAEDFKKRRGLNDDQFVEFLKNSKQYYDQNGVSYDDMYYLINRAESNANVANSTKKDMLTQMKNVRNIPTSQSSANSAKQSESQDDKLFDSLLGLDGGLDNLFS